MIYTIGINAGRKSTKLATLQAIVNALAIDRILDWRAELATNALDRTVLRDSFNGKYSYVGARCNAMSINASAINRLANLAGNSMLIFEKPIPGDCLRHNNLAMPLERLGLSVIHIYGEDLVTAPELQRSIEAGPRDVPAMTTWRPAQEPLPDIEAAPMPELARATGALENAICIAVQKGVLGNTRKLSTSTVTTEADKTMLRLSKALLDSPEFEATR